MESFFLKVVNLSITASYLVLALVLLRPLLKKLPRWLTAALWAAVAIRLLLPESFESALSMIPSTQTLPQNFVYAARPQIQSGISAVDSVVNPVLSQSMAPAPAASANPSQIWSFLFSWVWAVGVGGMGLYALVSWAALKLRMSTAVVLRENIRQSERVVSPFVLGFFRPVIYLPFQVDAQDLEHVIAHEKAHIRRRDHWWKPIGFALLAVHWFNPLMWLSYVLFCRDIEAACDEKVIAKLDHSQRQAYSTALLNCAVRHRAIAACPLAFGEVGVKERVKSVMHYKKPAFWIVLAGLLICVIVAVCFLTNPINASVVNPWVQEYIPGQGNILGSVDKDYFESKSPDFAIGADRYGRAVFKDPRKAFDSFLELCGPGLDLIRQEMDIPAISQRTYALYKKYGWQVTTGTPQQQELAHFVTKFLDIYENSFLETPPDTRNETPVTEAARNLICVDISFRKGYTCISHPREYELLCVLLEDCTDTLAPVEDPEQIAGVTADPYGFYHLSFQKPETTVKASVSLDGSWLWIDENGRDQIFRIAEPESLAACLGMLTDSLRNEPVSGSPFAQADAPWDWAKGVYSEALTDGKIYAVESIVREGNTTTTTAASGTLASRRLPELIELLNDLERQDFVPGEMLSKLSGSDLVYGGKPGSVSVLLFDGVNSLAAVLRFQDGKAMLLLSPEIEKFREDYRYLSDVEIWEIRDDALISFLEELYFYPTVVNHSVGSEYEWYGPVIKQWGEESLTLYLIEDWIHEEVNESTHSGIRIRPSKEETGWIYFGFWPEGYSPEEGDRYYSEAIDHGYVVNISYPPELHNNSTAAPEAYIWSYQSLHTAWGDYVIINDGADGWFLEYQDQIEDTISLSQYSLTFDQE